MKNIALLAGGNSGEHDVSLETAQNIQSLLNKEKFNTYFIYVEGINWYYIDNKEIKHNIDKNDFSLNLPSGKVLFDAVFIAIHGTPGENGLFQGYLDMLNIPYTGCDAFCSALTFNKYFCNIAVEKMGVPISFSMHFYKNEIINFDEIVEKCGLPCFVKPCNSGSSIGVTKAHNIDELKLAIEDAFKVDKQIMVEKFIPGRELTCGVAMIDNKPKALAITEILSKKEFYDFQAKYTPGYLEKVTPAQITPTLEKELRNYSELLYTKLGCAGVIRFDYMVTADDRPYFLEVNTIPGQTAMSLIPKQVKINNIHLEDFYENLILEALNK